MTDRKNNPLPRYHLRPMTAGLVPGWPEAIEGRRIHALCTVARMEAWAAAISNGAEVLAADRHGQLAYWAAHMRLITPDPGQLALVEQMARRVC